MFNLTVKFLGANLRARLAKVIEQQKVKNTNFVHQTYETDPASRTITADYVSPALTHHPAIGRKAPAAKMQQVNNPFNNDFRAC